METHVFRMGAPLIVGLDGRVLTVLTASSSSPPTASGLTGLARAIAAHQPEVAARRSPVRFAAKPPATSAATRFATGNPAVVLFTADASSARHPMLLSEVLPALGLPSNTGVADLLRTLIGAASRRDEITVEEVGQAIGAPAGASSAEIFKVLGQRLTLDKPMHWDAVALLFGLPADTPKEAILAAWKARIAGAPEGSIVALSTRTETGIDRAIAAHRREIGHQ